MLCMAVFHFQNPSLKLSLGLISSYEKSHSFEWLFRLSGWQDSNLRPPAPKAGAMTGLRYTPNGVFLKGLQMY